MRMKSILGLSVLILILVFPMHTCAISNSDSLLATKGSTFTLTVSIDSRTAKNESTFTVTVGLTVNAFASTVSRFYNIVLSAKVYATLNDSLVGIKRLSVDPITSVGQTQQAEIDFILVGSSDEIFSISGGASFKEDEPGSLDSETVTNWFVAYRNIEVEEAEFSGFLIIGLGLLTLITISRIYRKKKK
ncbi:MAG: hypothetical protein H7641_08790 [Candidatus Heimdallarchaeota archaeon]|nr:hypothetical protein [Candidatus Heimdallarchaeota archaeon]MCK4877662.1 hypothetical protein [Candidatus Heimdallarchaeota archaeon]